MIRRSWALLLAAALAPSGGCIAQSGMGRARVLAPGTGEASVGLEGTLMALKMTPDQAAPVPWVQAVGGYHRGVGERSEVGARVWGLGVRGFGVVGGAVDGSGEAAASAVAGADQGSYAATEVGAGGSVGASPVPHASL